MRGSVFNVQHLNVRDLEALQKALARAPAVSAPQKDLKRLRKAIKRRTDAVPIELLDAIKDCDPATPEEHRLHRIAERLSEPDQLDRRFVKLSLVVAGEEGQMGQRPEPADDLRTIWKQIRHQPVVLLGPPGAGKSTLLKRLELDCAADVLDGKAEGQDRLSFCVRLNQFRPFRDERDEFTPTAHDWLAAQWTETFPHMPPLAHFLAEARMTLLLDGLNEMPFEHAWDYRARLGLWRDFLARREVRKSGNRIVLACRTQDYAEGLESEDRPVHGVEILALNDDQIRQFLESYCPDYAHELVARLQDPRERDLYSRPYYLKLLTDYATESRGELPYGRAELFTKYVRRALHREVTERKNPLFDDKRLIDEADRDQVARREWGDRYDLPDGGRLFAKLTDLAYQMQDASLRGESGVVSEDYETALSLIDDHELAPQIVKAGVSLGLLDLRLRQLQFAHQLLQEYFAARRLGAHPEPRRVRTDWREREPLSDLLVRLDKQNKWLQPIERTGWEETILLAAEMSQTPAAFIRGLLESNLPLAGRCAAQRSVRERLDDELIGQMRQELWMRSRDPGCDLRHRIAAGQALGELGHPDFRQQVGKLDKPYLVPPMVEIPGDTYTIGTDDGKYDDEGPPHAVPVETFWIARYPVTNAEWRLFMEAGGYEAEHWWQASAGDRDWWTGETTAEGDKLYFRELRSIYRENPGSFEQLVATSAWDQEQLESIQWLLQLDHEAFEAALSDQFRSGRRREPEFWRDERFNNPAQPVVGICWHEARAYCAWLNAQLGFDPYTGPIRLPTEAEWEVAARGGEARAYAYAGDFDPTRCNTRETRVRATTPVGVFPGGDTPHTGLVDMTGNVWEGTASRYEPPLWRPGEDREHPEPSPSARPEDHRRVVRGGSWDSSQDGARAAYRGGGHPSYRANGLGVRLASSAPIFP